MTDDEWLAQLDIELTTELFAELLPLLPQASEPADELRHGGLGGWLVDDVVEPLCVARRAEFETLADRGLLCARVLPTLVLELEDGSIVVAELGHEGDDRWWG